mgnify:CR=1 FL=1
MLITPPPPQPAGDLDALVATLETRIEAKVSAKIAAEVSHTMMAKVRLFSLSLAWRQ